MFFVNTLCFIRLQTITVPSDSDNSESSFSEDLKSARVSDTVEASAQTDEDQESRTVIPETPIEDSLTNRVGQPSIIQDNITLSSKESPLIELQENQNHSPVETHTTESQTLSGSKETQKNGKTQIAVDLPSTNDNDNTDNDDTLKNGKPADQIITSKRDQEGVSVLSQDSSDELLQNESIDKVIQKENVISDKTVVENDIHEQSNQKENIQENNNENLSEDTVTKNSNKDNSSSNKSQDESSIELPIQAEVFSFLSVSKFLYIFFKF